MTNDNDNDNDQFDEVLEALFDILSPDQRVAATFERLSSPKDWNEVEDLAMRLVVFMTQATRLRVAMELLAEDKRINNIGLARTLARDALQYADQFTDADVIASRDRVHGSSH